MTDLRFALRQLRRGPAYIAAAVLSLGIGMAVCAAVFSVLNGLVFADRPGIVDANAVIHIRWLGGQELLSEAEFDIIERELAPVLPAMFAQGERPLPVVLPSGPATTTVGFASPRFFETLGTVAKHGRLLSGVDQRLSAVMSETLWLREYGANPDVIGGIVVIGGRPFTIVGISPGDFAGLRLSDPGTSGVGVPQLWVPLDPSERTLPWLAVGARLPRQANVKALGIRLSVAAARAANEWPERHRPAALRWFRARLNWTDDPGEAFAVVGVFLFVPVSILLIGCANVINLQLARATERTHELNVRMTLGASRLQLVRLLMADVGILACVAGAVGWVGARLLLVSVQPLFARPLALDRTALWLLLLLVVVVITAAGSAPAWLSVRNVIAAGMKHGSDSLPHKRIRATLVVFQISASIVLLFLTGLGFRTLQAQRHKLPVHANEVLTARFDLSQLGQPARSAATFIDGTLVGLRDRGPVRAAAFATFLRYGQPVRFWLPGDAVSVPRTAYAGAVTNGWLDVMGIRLLTGRAFSDGGAATEVLLNETFASQLGGRATVLGTRLRLTGLDGTTQTRDVVGVVEDQITSPTAMALLPMPVKAPSRLVLLVRTNEAAAALPLVKRAVHAAEPLAPLDTIKSLSTTVEDAFSGLQHIVVVGAALAAMAILLATAGEYAVLAFSVRRRTREIGIRMAVGATRRAVVVLIVREGLTLSVGGLALGLCVALPVGVLMRSTWFGVSPLDLRTIAPVAASVLVVGLAASLLPAMRATRMNPAVALRDD